MTHPSTGLDYCSAPSVDRWLREWSQWELLHPGVTLRAKVVHVPRMGQQRVVTHLDIPGIELLAGVDEATREHWARASGRWERLAADGEPPRTVKPHIRAIVDLVDADFELLLRAVRWFRLNPRSGETIRRVPVAGMHTKWLKRHRRLVLAMLGLGAAPSVKTSAWEGGDREDLPDAELDLLGLKPLPPQIDMLVLDSAIRATIGGLRRIRAPLQEIAALPISPNAVLVVENQEAEQ